VEYEGGGDADRLNHAGARCLGWTRNGLFPDHNLIHCARRVHILATRRVLHRR
jgi:hypothetical protein